MSIKKKEVSNHSWVLLRDGHWLLYTSDSLLYYIYKREPLLRVFFSEANTISFLIERANVLITYIINGGFNYEIKHPPLFVFH